MSIYYNCVQYGTNVVVLSYVDDYVYWYTSESLRKWFVDMLGNVLHVNFFGYGHWSMSIIIYQMNYHYISVDHARCSTSIVAKYFDTPKAKTSIKKI